MKSFCFLIVAAILYTSQTVSAKAPTSVKDAGNDGPLYFPVDEHTLNTCPPHEYKLINYRDLPGTNGLMTDYNAEQVSVQNSNSFTITLDIYKPGETKVDPKGARVRTRKAYSEGVATATISSGAVASGIIGAFYLSNQEPVPGQPRTQDEIDFEFMGKDLHTQTNFFINGNGGNERMIYMNHLDEHTYTIQWNATHAVLSIDGNTNVQVYYLYKQPRPMKIYFSFWGSKPCDSYVDWSGIIPSNYLGTRHKMVVKNFSVTGKEATPVGLGDGPGNPGMH